MDARVNGSIDPALSFASCALAARNPAYAARAMREYRGPAGPSTANSAARYPSPRTRAAATSPRGGRSNGIIGAINPRCAQVTHAANATSASAAIAGTSLPMTSGLNASSHVRRRPLDGEWCPAVWAPSCVADDANRLGEFNNAETTTTRVIFLVLVEFWRVCSHTIVRFEILTTCHTVHTVNINHHRLFAYF